jgi:hypothetical protein
MFFVLALQTLFLGARRVAGDGSGEAFVDPVTGSELTAHRRVTGGGVVLGEIIAEEIDGPVVFYRTAMAGTVGSQLLNLCRDALPQSGRPPPVGGCYAIL